MMFHVILVVTFFWGGRGFPPQGMLLGASLPRLYFQIGPSGKLTNRHGKSPSSLASTIKMVDVSLLDCSSKT